MKLWQTLYGMIWIVLVEFLLAMTPVGDRLTLLALHVALGLGILALAWQNFDAVRKTKVPGRVKRIAESTFKLSVAMAVLGALLAARIGADVMIPVVSVSLGGIILFVHVVNAFAIITQAAATAIAYDMWEEKEFVKETVPGEVPLFQPPAKPRVVAAER